MPVVALCKYAERRSGLLNSLKVRRIRYLTETYKIHTGLGRLDAKKLNDDDEEF